MAVIFWGIQSLEVYARRGDEASYKESFEDMMHLYKNSKSCNRILYISEILADLSSLEKMLMIQLLPPDHNYHEIATNLGDHLGENIGHVRPSQWTAVTDKHTKSNIEFAIKYAYDGIRVLEKLKRGIEKAYAVIHHL